MIYLVSNTDFKDDEVKKISLLKIKYFKFSPDFSAFDTIIISSKNSIGALKFNGFKDFDIPVFAISKASAQTAMDFGFVNVVNFGANSATYFSDMLAKRPDLGHGIYLRGEDIAFDLALNLKDKGVKISELICYKNEPNQSEIFQAPKPKSVIIFASSLNFKSFFKKFGWSNSWRAVAIGKSTALALKEHGISFKIPQNPSLKECISLAKAMQKEHSYS